MRAQLKTFHEHTPHVAPQHVPTPHRTAVAQATAHLPLCMNRCGSERGSSQGAASKRAVAAGMWGGSSQAP